MCSLEALPLNDYLSTYLCIVSYVFNPDYASGVSRVGIWHVIASKLYTNRLKTHHVRSRNIHVTRYLCAYMVSSQNHMQEIYYLHTYIESCHSPA